jgi:site-specific recombinase XerD
MLDQGADLRLIMETLGHSQISVTADLYAHVLKPRQRAASEAVDTLILGPEDDGDEPAEGE